MGMPMKLVVTGVVAALLATATLLAAYLLGDRGTARQAVTLGVVITLTHIGAVLVLGGALYDYFGLTAGNSYVLAICLIALVLWFGALTAAYRRWLLDRALGLDALTPS
jgi:ABC-type nickel/cobalt efflux system permease component RcnA